MRVAIFRRLSWSYSKLQSKKKILKILLSQITSVNCLWFIHSEEEQFQCKKGACADKGYDACDVCENWID